VTKTTHRSGHEGGQRLFASDRASQSLGMQLVETGAGLARVSMTVRTDMTNGHGICHGGFIFALADSAFAFACNSHGEPTVASGATIDFLAPARVDDQLTAVAREQWRGGRIGIYDVVVMRADGTVIAQVRGRSHRLARAEASPASKD
jgi:acyl-CoA thioesterase